MRYAVGQPVPRTEDPRLLRGAGRFAADVVLARETHAAVVRSPYAHADLGGVEISAALAVPGVLAVLTGRDWLADGLGDLPAAAPRRRRDGSPMFRPPRPPLAVGRVRHVGQPVAFVLAETAAAAREAAEAVEVDYEPRAAVVDPLAAAAPGAPAVWDECPGNESFLFEAGDARATEAALASAARVVRQRYVVSRVHACTLEPRAVVAAHDPGRERFEIHTGAQRPYAWRAAIARVLGVAEHQVALRTGDVGGSFGMKGSLHPEVVLAAWAARRLGRPVKWVCERSEAFVADDHGRDNVTDVELGLDPDGRFVALRVRTWANLGAFLAFNGVGPPTANVGSLAGTYLLPAAHVRVSGMWTHTTPLSPYRGAGRPEAAYVLERTIDIAARELGLDPVDLRRRNLIPASAMPHRTALVYTYDCGDFEGVLDECMRRADHAGFARRREAAAARGRLRGLGVSLSIEIAARVQSETAELRFDPSGGATVLAGTTSQGQGHETVYTQIVCERLGLDPARVRVVEGDTDLVPFGTGTGGSRCSALGTAAVTGALEKVIEKGRRIAAHLLEAAPVDLAFDEGRYVIPGTDRAVPFEEVARAAFEPARLPAGVEPGLFEIATFQPEAPNFPNACHACEVEIDPETGAVELCRYTVVDDVGTELNPLLLAGQVRGGVAQGAGQALLERVVYDPETGQLLTGSLVDYALARAGDLCRCEVAGHPVPTATNPLGAKGAGESGTVGALAAVMNAVNDALAPLGVRHLEMPATPERVWAAVRGALSGR